VTAEQWRHTTDRRKYVQESLHVLNVYFTVSTQ